MFNYKNINCVDRVENWQEAIKLSAKPLLESESIVSAYIDKMIENITKLGFYVVLDEYVAMPHARPEDGVMKTSISFLKVNEGVYFGEDIIYLIFTLSAKDSNEHINILQKLMEIFQDEELKSALINAKDIDSLIKLLK